MGIGQWVHLKFPKGIEVLPPLFGPQIRLGVAFQPRGTEPIAQEIHCIRLNSLIVQVRLHPPEFCTVGPWVSLRL